jgi:HlyD family secretion protein
MIAMTPPDALFASRASTRRRSRARGAEYSLAATRVSFFCLLGLLHASLGCGNGNRIDPGPTATVERGRIERIVVATGTIEPEREVLLRPRIPGIVEKILVDTGDDVERGQVLIEIERELLDTKVRAAQAALDEAKIEERYAKRGFDRMNQLQTTGVSSDEALDNASSRIESARAAVSRAEANFDELSTQLGYATIKSPLTGRVLDVHVEEGDAISPITSVNGGTLLASLAGTQVLHLEGLVDENEVARVVEGQRARIRTEAYSGREFEAVVTEIAPLGQRIQNVTYFEVELEVTDPDAQLLRPRMSGDAEIVAEVVEGATLVPETALRYTADRIYVNTITGGDNPQIVEKNVEVGIVDGDRVQILSGLVPDEVVQLQ